MRKDNGMIGQDLSKRIMTGKSKPVNYKTVRAFCVGASLGMTFTLVSIIVIAKVMI